MILRDAKSGWPHFRVKPYPGSTIEYNWSAVKDKPDWHEDSLSEFSRALTLLARKELVLDYGDEEGEKQADLLTFADCLALGLKGEVEFWLSVGGCRWRVNPHNGHVEYQGDDGWVHAAYGIVGQYACSPKAVWAAKRNEMRKERRA